MYITKLKNFNFLLILIFISICLKSEGQTTKHTYKNPTGDEFPIMGWSTFYKADNITEKNFKTFRDCGFNITLSMVGDTALTFKTIRCAAPNKVKVMVNCPQTKNITSIPKVVPAISKSTDIAGYYITDEPDASKFNDIRKVADELYKYDKNQMPFVNLLPMVEPSRLKAANYKTYLLEFLRITGIPMFSYDCYPIIKKNGKISIKETFYQNLEIASEVSRETGAPFWAFCMSASHLSYPKATKGHLLFEAFSALAYGAQGISYYTYTTRTNESIKYYDAPINTKGEKTATWYACQDVNKQIQSLKNVFLGAKLQNAWHTGDKLPKGTKRLGKLPGPFQMLKSEKAGVLVSHLKNRDSNYLVVVNHDVQAKQKIQIKKDNKVKRITPEGGIIEDTVSEFTLEAGGYLIFKW